MQECVHERTPNIASKLVTADTSQASSGLLKMTFSCATAGQLRSRMPDTQRGYGFGTPDGVRSQAMHQHTIPPHAHGTDHKPSALVSARTPEPRAAGPHLEHPCHDLDAADVPLGQWLVEDAIFGLPWQQRRMTRTSRVGFGRHPRHSRKLPRTHASARSGPRANACCGAHRKYAPHVLDAAHIP